MKHKPMITSLAILIVLFLGIGIAAAQEPEPTEPITAQAALGTAFTYQGRLTDGGSPANGAYDFQFGLYSGGDLPDYLVNKDDVTVTDGLFTVQLDFGSNVFRGGLLYELGISVRPGGSSGAYTLLTPRQKLTPAPYALALPGLWTQQNTGSPNLIGGYSGNSVTSGAVGATIGGGGESGATNRVTDDYGTVGGGASNWAGDGAGTSSDSQCATVGGGYNNTASGDRATVGGGYNNTASGDRATVGGGYGNTASNRRATVGGGEDNEASASDATVGGGEDNEASGFRATVPGGYDNTAQGSYSFAAGRRARANNQGCFVWGDSTNSDVSCNNNNRTIFRSSGGFYIYTSSDLSTGMYLTAGGSGWNAVSNRQLKENLAPVDGGQLLERLAQVEIGTWNYKAQDPAIRHIGPMADDFNALVDGLGGEGMDHINSLDADGVALASIQELYRRSQEQAARIEKLEAENAALRQQVSDLEARLAALERTVAGEPQVGGGEP